MSLAPVVLTVECKMECFVCVKYKNSILCFQ